MNYFPIATLFNRQTKRLHILRVDFFSSMACFARLLGAKHRTSSPQQENESILLMKMIKKTKTKQTQPTLDVFSKDMSRTLSSFVLCANKDNIPTQISFFDQNTWSQDISVAFQKSASNSNIWHNGSLSNKHILPLYKHGN